MGGCDGGCRVRRGEGKRGEAATQARAVGDALNYVKDRSLLQRLNETHCC